MITQSDIRQKMLMMRRQLDEQCINTTTSIFNDRLLDFARQFSSIAMYSAVANEISVNCVADLLCIGVKLSLPKINSDDELDFVEYEDPSLWQTGKYNIPEPTTNIIDYVPDVFLVPLTVIDHVGVRVGMGKGYYDRYLKNCVGKSLFVGVGWDFQLIDQSIVVQPHDIKMDYFISPTQLIKFDR